MHPFHRNSPPYPFKAYLGYLHEMTPFHVCSSDGASDRDATHGPSDAIVLFDGKSMAE